MKNINPLVSVIIPVHEWNELAFQAINSVEMQSYSRFEIIVIAPCLPPQSLNARLFVTDTLNGPGESRNLGMSHACGEYITFVDSDDLVHSNMLEKFVSCVITNSAEVIITPIVELVRDGNIIPTYDKSIYSRMGVNIYKDSSLYGKLFKLDFLKKNGVKFPDKTYGEDMHFVFHAYLYSTILVACDRELYLHRQHASSLLCSIDSYGLKEVADCYDVFCRHQNMNKKIQQVIKSKILKILFIHLVSFSKFERAQFLSWKNEITVVDNCFWVMKVHFVSMLRKIAWSVLPKTTRSVLKRIIFKQCRFLI